MFDQPPDNWEPEPNKGPLEPEDVSALLRTARQELDRLREEDKK